MDLTRALLRFGAGRPHVLVVEVPGGWRTRWAVEGELRRRGWPRAASPAEADLLVIVGTVGERTGPYVERVWCQVPAPRARVHPGRVDEVVAALHEAVDRLAAGGEAGPPAGRGDAGMEMPGGLPMAERAADRDGLMLDQLHVPVGPLLPEWPAGLIVHATLQGDVVQHARTEVVADESFGPDTGRRTGRGRVVSCLDSLARLLAVAGWQDAAVCARRSRDDVLAGVSAGVVAVRLRRLVRRVRRSRTLRWLTAGLGLLSPDAAREHGVTGLALSASRAGGDVRARYVAWLSAIEQALPHLDEVVDPVVDEPGPLLAVLPGLLEGAEFAGARLIVASLDPDVTALDRRGAGTDG